jgi:chromosome partitioning protein
MMLNSPKKNDLQRIVVLNPKGGCGKSTLATNLASYYALRGPLPVLVDCDPQGFSMRWLERRSTNRPSIHGIAAYKKSLSVTNTWQMRVPSESRRVIIDSPAALENRQIHELIYDATNVIIPVLPSPIDIRCAARFIAELLLVTQLDRGEIRVGIVANRTRKNTKSLVQLNRFLTSLKIPVIATLRDSQNYVEAVGRGVGVYELPDYKARRDIEDLSKIVAWLDRWRIRGQDTLRQSTPDEVGPSLPRHLH